jgi:hypothetical protein
MRRLMVMALVLAGLVTNAVAQEKTDSANLLSLVV